MKAVVAVLVAALVLLSGASAQASTRRITRERLAEWHDKLYGTINTLGAPGGGSSGLRAWAMMNIAMFDAANLCDDRKYETYLRYDLNAIPVDLDKCEPLAAAAKAAQIVLNSLIPASVVGTTRTNLEFSHLSQFLINLGALPRNTKTSNGVSLGAFVGAAVVANRTGDGHPPNNCNNWPNPATPACPNSVPNATGTWFKYQYNLPYHPGQPNSPGYPQVKPFAIPSYQDSLFAVPPPPAPGTPAYATAFAETFGYGASDPARSTRTQEKSDIARFHDGNFASQVGFASDWLATSGVTVDGVDLLRGVMLAAISSHDAHATHWFYKYTHYNARPIAAYRQIPTDYPDLGQFNDPNWFPTLTTSQTPEYPSGHSSRSGGACNGFIKAFGDIPVNGVFRTISYSSPAQGERSYSSVSSFCAEIDNSRIWGGVHWRYATNAGSDLSRRVANYVFDNVARLSCDDD